jgi:hypothetical protein
MSKVKDLKEVKEVEEQVAPEQEDNKANAIVITIDLAQALVEYLKTKPMGEVEVLVNAIVQSQGVTLEQAPQE